MVNVEGIHYGYRKQKYLLPRPDILGALEELREQRIRGEVDAAELPTKLDYTHLNSRRQNSRTEKAGEEKKWIRMVSKAREEGALDAQKLATRKAQEREVEATA